MNKARGLGRGLDILLPTGASRPPPLSQEPTRGNETAFLCALERLVPNRGQPRRRFDDAALEELAQSIRENGVIEPLVVRRIGSEDRFEIIAGERRWRAAQRAALREVMVVVKTLDDKKAYEAAVIENVQREDLNPIELAMALRVLCDDHGHTQESLAKALGKDRTTISNGLRLLKLPARVQEWVAEGNLSEGHARALLGASEDADMTRLAESAIKNKLSVRQLESEVRALRKPKSGEPRSKTASVKDLEHRLSRSLGTRCQLRDRAGKGMIVIRYGDLDELDRLLERLL